MSYGLHPFVVSTNQMKEELNVPAEPMGILRRIFGSGRKDLIKEMKRRDPNILADEDNGFDDDYLAIEQALREMISGKDLDPNSGHAYAFALMALCWHFGEFQDNSHWSNIRAHWAGTVDTAMRDAGVSHKSLGIITHIMFRGAPIDIPASGDEPGVGYLLNSELPAAIQAIEQAEFSSTNSEALEAINAVAKWLKRAQECKRDLVCFYY